MATVTVQLLFSGLIAFAPKPAAQPELPPTELRVLIPNGNNFPHMAHRSYLSVLTETDPVGDFEFSSDPQNGPFAKRTFIGEGYRIEMAPTSAKSFEYDRCRFAPPDDSTSVDERICLVSSREIVDSGWKAKEIFLKGEDKEVARELSGWLNINHGKFGPLDEQIYMKEAEKEGQLFPILARNLLWPSAADDSLISRQTPELMVWEFELPSGSEVKLEFKHFGNFGDSRKIVVKPDGNGLIRMLISNEPEPLEFCLSGHKENRYSANHLGHMIKRLSSSPPRITRSPELSNARDRESINKFCDGLGGQGGRQPVICYGVGLEWP